MNYTNLIPLAPLDLIEWSKPLFKNDDEFLVFKHKSKELYQIWCSGCEHHFTEFKEYILFEIKNIGYYQCPNCGEERRLLHSSDLGRYRRTERVVTVFDKIGSNLVLINYLIIRKILKSFQNTYEHHTAEAYVFEDKKCVRLKGVQHNYFGLHLKPLEQLARYKESEFYCQNFYPIKDDFIKGTTMKNSRLDIYLKSINNCHPVEYLKLYQKKNKIETLIDIGLMPAIASCLENTYRHRVARTDSNLAALYLLNWKEKSPYKIVGLTKHELKLIKNPSMLQLSTLCRLKNQGVIMNTETIKTILSACKDRYDVINILNEQKNANAFEIIKYLNKQRKNYSYLKDYWDMAEKLGYSLEDKKRKFPSSLEIAHNNAAGLIEYKKTEASREKFLEIKNNFKKLLVEKNNIYIDMPECDKDLYLEGKNLHHCVGNGSYANSHIEGQSIFFIRKADERDIAWYTLQVDLKTGRQLQLHGYRNDAGRKIPDEVKSFVNWWLTEVFKPYDVKKHKFIKQKQKAKTA